MAVSDTFDLETLPQHGVGFRWDLTKSHNELQQHVKTIHHHYR
jgi:hypothetical protein